MEEIGKEIAVLRTSGVYSPAQLCHYNGQVFARIGKDKYVALYRTGNTTSHPKTVWHSLSITPEYDNAGRMVWREGK